MAERRRRRDAREHIPHDAAAHSREQGEHDDAENVHPLLDADHRTGDSECYGPHNIKNFEASGMIVGK